MYKYLVDLLFGEQLPALGRNMPLTLSPDLITTTDKQLQEVRSKLRKVKRNIPYRSPMNPLFQELHDYFKNRS